MHVLFLNLDPLYLIREEACLFIQLASLLYVPGTFIENVSFFNHFFRQKNIFSREVSADQGPVVRKPINDNPRLKVNRGFQLARSKCF